MTSKPLKTVEEKTAYMVDRIKQYIIISAAGKEIKLSCSGLADGCIGISLWFDTLDDAVAYSEDKDHISKAKYNSKELAKELGASTKGGQNE